MKKLQLISIILLLTMLISTLVACNTEDTTDTTKNESDSTITDSASEETNEETDEETDETTSDDTSESTSEDSTENKNDDWDTLYDIISIEKALELCGEEGNLTTKRYYIRGTIKSITNPQYGAMIITDGTNEISVYGTYSKDGSVGYSSLENKPYKDDEVLLYCTLQNYNGTKEIKSAWLIDFKKSEIKVDENDYTDMSIKDARNADVGTKIKVDGVVARITYAFGMKPSGFYLVDETQSIYVYDGDAAARVKIGNKVTILGSKTYWILESEQTSAEKFGYKGCNQLESVTIKDLDTNTYDFDKSWITESTVKDILNTPVTEDVTTTIYKVNALVKKVPDQGFTNYYIYDIDGITGYHTYTQCNGNDFTWLDEFDGKICTVYLSPMNAKSTSTACNFRFLPVHVSYDNYKFDTSKASEYALKYHAVDQFLSTYAGNPAKELISSVSNELLGIENVKITYTSSNEKAVYFTNENGKVILNCDNPGKATVTITAEYNGNKETATVEIIVKSTAEYKYISVGEAIKANVGDIITVKGIVGPSVVNKSGFYLISDDGVIAVIVNADAFEDLSIGDEVILKGKRENYMDPEKGDSSVRFGQTCIVDAEILVNNYGENEYSKETFVTDKTLKDFASLKITEDHTTTVYVLEVKVEVVETAYYTNINIVDNDGNKVLLYSSSAAQYNWIKEFAGKTITVEMIACNWNNKKDNYRGCILAVYGEDGTIYNTLNFNK